MTLWFSIVVRPQRLFLRERFFPLFRWAWPPCERRILPPFESFMRLTAHFFVFILGICLSFLLSLPVGQPEKSPIQMEERVVYTFCRTKVKGVWCCLSTRQILWYNSHKREDASKWR